MRVRLIPFTEDMCINESPAPVTESDTINLVDKERELNINGPMGDNLFMTSEKKHSRRILEDKIRSYIKLCVPVINTLITDVNNNIAINILNLSRKEINEIIKGQITVLLRLKENVLDSLYTRTIRVLPRGMRPMIDGRSNSMTVMYSDVLRIDRVLRRLTDADKDIKQLSRINQPAIYAAKYRNLQYAFDFLVSCTEKQREERTKSTDKNRKCKSIFQYTSTKEGYIKPKKVQDFSGRSVIVADPDLSVDEVRLPKEMADVIMEYLTKIKPEKNQSLDEVIKHVSVVINRAVTLHRISLRGYKVKISDNNSIGVNPLSAEGFDFDHDGDTMAVHNGLLMLKETCLFLLQVKQHLCLSRNLYVDLISYHHIKILYKMKTQWK